MQINSSTYMAGSKNTSRVPEKKKSEKSLGNIIRVHLIPPEKKFSPHTVLQYRVTQNVEKNLKICKKTASAPQN